MELQWRKLFNNEYGTEYGDFIGFNRFGEPLAKIYAVWVSLDGSPLLRWVDKEQKFKHFYIEIYQLKRSVNTYIFEEYDLKKAMLYAESLLENEEE